MPRQVLAATAPNGAFDQEHLLNPTMLRRLGDESANARCDGGSTQGGFSRLLAARSARVVGLNRHPRGSSTRS
jgi:hypothetical protein